MSLRYFLLLYPPLCWGFEGNINLIYVYLCEILPFDLAVVSILCMVSIIYISMYPREFFFFSSWCSRLVVHEFSISMNFSAMTTFTVASSYGLSSLPSGTPMILIFFLLEFIYQIFSCYLYIYFEAFTHIVLLLESFLDPIFEFTNLYSANINLLARSEIFSLPTKFSVLTFLFEVFWFLISYSPVLLTVHSLVSLSSLTILSIYILKSLQKNNNGSHWFLKIILSVLFFC